MSAGTAPPGDVAGVLQRIRERRPRAVAPAGERCELCAEAIAEAHSHLVDIRDRRMLCSCRGCYLLFVPEGAGGSRYRAVPDRYVALTGLELTRSQWDALQIPVSVAFFFFSSATGEVAAFYPSPAGATESLLPLEVWQEIVAGDARLGSMEPDVEALLVRTERDGTGAEPFIVPIDACYELVGHLRALWRGFDGGQEARDALDAFFDRVRSRVR